MKKKNTTPTPHDATFRQLLTQPKLQILVMKLYSTRHAFNFNDEQYAEFIDMLDAPVVDEPAINKLLARKPQWDV
ncbi:UNVERIFIED_ORG: hypothetical protein FHU01_4444 [Citrobacter freundii]